MLSGDLKDGLVDLILGIYDYDPNQKDTTKAVCRAAERMGILDPQVTTVSLTLNLCRTLKNIT
jgi:hypothetical protein